MAANLISFPPFSHQYYGLSSISHCPLQFKLTPPHPNCSRLALKLNVPLPATQALHRDAFSAQTSNGDESATQAILENDAHKSSPASPPHGHSQLPPLDRRELMAASIAAGMSLLSPHHAIAAPVVPPDLDKCGLATVNAPPGQTAPTSEVLCCVPEPTRPVKSFTFESKPPRHIRRPAHLVDAKYIAKYNKAYELMKALPITDPRNFTRQSDIHCSFCNGAYTQQGSTNKLQVHFSWLFLPWHRWYLYYHERILGSLIGDPNFSLVFWNWDNQVGGGNMMPAMFTPQNSALYDSKRNQAHLPPTLNSLNVASLSSTTLQSNSQITQDNLNIMYQSMVTASTPDLFMGKQYSAGQAEPNVGGTLENGPHNAIHGWTGDPRQTYLEDMGNFYSAGKDPIFFAHHSNVDRLWTIWNTIGGRRKDHTDPDFLDAEFIFYDENADLVTVNVRDALDSSKLGIFYEPVRADTLWLNYNPQPLSPTKAPSLDKLPVIGPADQNDAKTDVGKKLASKAKRPSGPSQDLLDSKGLRAEEAEEVLVFEEVEVPRNTFIHLAVFINLPEADDQTTLSSAEYVGSFYNVPHFMGEMEMSNARKVDVRFGISDNITRLGIKGVSEIAVTIVNKLAGADASVVPITLKGIKIEYE